MPKNRHDIFTAALALITVSLIALLSLQCSSAVMVQCEPASSSSTFRIMSYNIQSGHGFDQVYNLSRQVETMNRIINSARLDIDGDLVLISLQEVDNMTQRHPGDDQMAILSSGTKMSYLEFAKFRPFQGGAYGIGIMSRLRIVEYKILNYEKPADKSSSSSSSSSSSWRDQSHQRMRHHHHGRHRRPSSMVDERCAKYAPDDFCQGALAVRIQLPQSALSIWYVNTHLGLAGVQAEEARQLVHRLIVPLQQETNIPIIVSGDFNAEPESEAIQIMLHEAQLTDTWKVCGDGSSDGHGFTFDSHKPTKRIDYQLLWVPDHLRGQFRCVRARVPVTEASDHRPYVVQYSFTPATAAN